MNEQAYLAAVGAVAHHFGEFPHAVCILTFGCQQNEADSEKLRGMAHEMGYTDVDDPAEADLILLNTCAIREHAEQKVLSYVGRLKEYREKNPALVVGICGCMTAQPHRVKQIRERYPQVSFTLDPASLDRFPETLATVLEAGKRTFVTGSPMAEVLHENLDSIEKSDILKRLGLEPKKYMLLSAHREENIDTEKNFLSLFNAINRLAEKYDMPILYSCHPRSRKRLEATGFELDPRVIRHEPLGFHDYNNLQMNAFAVVSDSGTLPEESSFFTSVGKPFPAVCIRTSTERPEALDKACFILAGIGETSLLRAVETAVDMNENGDLGIPVPYYTEENVSTKVVKIIESYTDVVNKMVWRKS